MRSDCCQNKPRKMAPAARVAITDSVFTSVNHIASASITRTRVIVTAIAPALGANAPSRQSSSRSFRKAAVSFLRALAKATSIDSPIPLPPSTIVSSTMHPTSNALRVLYTSGP